MAESFNYRGTSYTCPHCKLPIEPGSPVLRRPDTYPVGPWLHEDCFNAESSVCPCEVGLWRLIGPLEASVEVDDLRVVVSGGARDKRALNGAVKRLRAALPGE